MEYLLGLDIGSSSVKASIVDIPTGSIAAHDHMPKNEMPITAVQAGWAEQNPEEWYRNMKLAIAGCMRSSGISPAEIKGIGISYQMHGLVLADQSGNILRPAIIWCDSRAVQYGQRALDALGYDYCMGHLLNSPGNFTAAKMAWVKENEPGIFDRAHIMMLPGDYIAMRLTGEISTTVSGLSEAMLWDFSLNRVATELLEYYGIPSSIVPETVPTFGIQGRVSHEAASDLGLCEGTPVCYRAGDQPNNALSLNVLKPGEIASTAGTSGVVYGVSGRICSDPQSRVNLFAHVNHTPEVPRLGVLCCINGAGILNTWLRHSVMAPGAGYSEMDHMAEQVPIGSEGLTVLPFGNGAERILHNRDTGAVLHGINFNIHQRAHILRAAQEGIVFSFVYGMEIMQKMGMEIRTVKAGKANMFLSPVFRATLAGTAGVSVKMYDTDGSVGAAKGAGIGAGIYADANEAFSSLRELEVTEPRPQDTEALKEAYQRWKSILMSSSGTTTASKQ